MLPDSTTMGKGGTTSDRKRKKSSNNGTTKSKLKKTDKKKEKKFVKKKREKHSRKGENDPDSDLDLNRVFKPIGDYMKDREEMVTQMFKAIHSHQLQTILPGIMKNTPMDELKQLCVEHLEGMSKKRIQRIIKGDDPANISSSGTEEDWTNDDEDNIETREKRQAAADSTSRPADVQFQSGSSAGGAYADVPPHKDCPRVKPTERSLKQSSPEQRSSDFGSPSVSIHADDEDMNSIEIEKRHGRFSKKNQIDRIEPPESLGKDLAVQDTACSDREAGEIDPEIENISVADDEMEMESFAENAMSVLDDGEMTDDGELPNSEEDPAVEAILDEIKANQITQPPAIGLSKTQMEILELEMRARAIKAMLTAQEAVVHKGNK